MANKPISMLKIRRVLQLIEKGISQRRICRELQMGRGTFGEYQARIGNSGLSIKSLLQLSDCELSELLSPERSYSGDMHPPKKQICLYFMT